MKRTGFARPAPRPAKVIDYQPRPRAAAVAVAGPARAVVAAPKNPPLRDETYRRWVASLPCAHCQVEGFSQAAHADQGKGLAIKSGDETCFPLCGPHLNRFGGLDPGCHYQIGTGGFFTKAERRELEARYGAQTRALWREREGAMT